MALCTRSFQAVGTSRRAFTPFQGAQKQSIRVCASGGDSDVSSAVVAKKVPVLTWQTDKESIADVFAFAGSAPERLNGRMAMFGFAGIALTEYSKHTPALEQLGEAWPFVIVYGLLLTFATIAPKLVSGSSLKDLHEAANSANLGGEGFASTLSIFDTNNELWTGRIAMLGLVGLIANEVFIKGDSFF